MLIGYCLLFVVFFVLFLLFLFLFLLLLWIGSHKSWELQL